MDKLTLSCSYQPKDKLSVSLHNKCVYLRSAIDGCYQEPTIVLDAQDTHKLRAYLKTCLAEIERSEPVPLTADDVRRIVQVRASPHFH
jgi:hypothetical protein